jgi:nucleotide-binding universal stress UspA family protein
MKAIESILLALDLTPASDAVVRRGVWLAQQVRPRHVQLLHVLDGRMLDALAGLRLASRAELEAAARSAAENALSALAERIRAVCDATVEAHCLSGRPDAELSAVVVASAPDLILAGAGNRLWRQALLGSTVRRLLRLLKRPLWLVREDGENPIRRILLASDLAASCGAACEIAAMLWPRAEFELIHVQAEAAALVAGLPGIAEVNADALQQTLQEQARPHIDAFVKHHLPGAAVAVNQATGHPVAMVLARAREWQPDLLVLGRGGRAGPALGSVVEGLADLVECDLLVVPAA